MNFILTRDNTNFMKKKSGFLSITKKFLCLICCSAILFVAIITEPCVKIHGFSSYDKSKLSTKILCKAYYQGGEEIDSTQSFASYDQLPKHLIDAFISVEDKRFFEHEGVDFFRIISATAKNISSKKFKEGASTITQQTAKNTHLSPEKDLKRKIEEVRIARSIERKNSKRKILESYLNKIYFGNNCYGIAEAAKFYFNKYISELDAGQSATLAAIINNPSLYNPLTSYSRCLNRRNLILELMYRDGKITKNEFFQQKSSPIQLSCSYNTNNIFNFAIQEAARILDCSYNTLTNGNYEIHTTLDKKIGAEETLNNYTKSLNSNCNLSVIVSNKAGEIIYLYSSGEINPLATRRCPASTIKPFLSYAPALENGSIVPITPILDEQTEFGDYHPKNYRNKYLGWASASECLALSQNIPAIKLFASNGISYSKNIAKKFGFKFTKADDHLALPLGSTENGATLNEINSAYATLQRDGFYKKNFMIKSIKKDGKILYENLETPVRAVSEETAYFITNMLQSCVQNGTAKKLSSCDFDVAAKTGTAGNKTGNTDAYCVAYTPQYSVSVAISAKTSKMNNDLTGGGICCEICKNLLFMLDIDRKICFSKPKSIVTLDIDKHEYEANNKVVLALGAKKIDTIKAEFSAKKLPLSYKYYLSEYILQMDKTVFD